MPNAKQIAEKAVELMKQDAVIVTAAEIEHGVLSQVQLYFRSGDQSVMDIVSKDDLVQNWPDAGVYALLPAPKLDQCLRKIRMFEGREDMYFRIDGSTENADDLGPLPGVVFMEAVEAICGA